MPGDGRNGPFFCLRFDLGGQSRSEAVGERSAWRIQSSTLRIVIAGSIVKLLLCYMMRFVLRTCVHAQLPTSLSPPTRVPTPAAMVAAWCKHVHASCLVTHGAGSTALPLQCELFSFE